MASSQGRAKRYLVGGGSKLINMGPHPFALPPSKKLSTKQKYFRSPLWGIWVPFLDFSLGVLHPPPHAPVVPALRLANNNYSDLIRYSFQMTSAILLLLVNMYKKRRRHRRAGAKAVYTWDVTFRERSKNLSDTV